MENPKKKIILFGAGGMLAFDILKVFNPEEYQFLLTDNLEKIKLPGEYLQADITNIDNLKFLFEFQPDFVINASAYTDVDGCETNPKTAYAVNDKGAGNIAKLCRQNGAVLVHISTDYVFDGTKSTPYIESDKVNPQGSYGKSKLKGELAVEKYLKNYFICRTALLYGSNRTNFVQKILEKAKKGEEITVPDDMFGSPTWTVELARQILKLTDTKEYGLYHTANEGSCSRYEWAVKACELAVIKAKIRPIKTADITPKPKASRPQYSTLEAHMLKQNNLYVMQTWEKALEEFVKS